ncbi:hypothetical protein MVEN_01300800 [Mycena venus]|uniref:Uncharacterized protein n=1 Tax=Mycena venus TaxID=2733690 RepID=A0A8H7CWL1_9AGAR|nr:hypothetical protein MVEN_01300800 [Mycena venus]
MSLVIRLPPPHFLYTSPTMLILLILAHLLTKNSGAVPVALPLDPRSSADSCDDINNCRKLFDIVWGCLATIFACTWVSVHPNVPPPDQSGLALFWRRLKMMLVGIIAPEIMVGFAARQFLGARMLSKSALADSNCSDSYQSHEIFPEYGFSMIHGFFFCMGGFISSTGYPVAWLAQLKDPDFGSEFLKSIRQIRAEEIADKSKGDALSKGVALAQGIWFTTQCLARVHQHLAVTELEVATLAFAVVNVFIWLLWWDKPLDVQLPIIIGPPTPVDTEPITPAQKPRFDRFIDSIVGYIEGDYDPLSSTSVPSFWSPPTSSNFQFGIMGITALAGTVFGAIHCAAWNTDFLTAVERWIWRSSSVVILTVPVVLFVDALLGFIIETTAFGEKNLGAIALTIAEMVFYGSSLMYIAARLILIALPVAALRFLRSSAFMDVNWSAYIPHI